MAAFQQVNIFNHNSESWTSCTVSEKVSELLSSEMEMFDWLCVSEYFNHLNSRLDVAELNGAKFYGTAHGTSSPHTHARTHINDTLPYGMLVQPKHPSWLTCLPQRVCLRACWQREERNQEWADWSGGLRPQRESWALRGCEFWGQNMITFLKTPWLWERLIYSLLHTRWMERHLGTNPLVPGGGVGDT